MGHFHCYGGTFDRKRKTDNSLIAKFKVTSIVSTLGDAGVLHNPARIPKKYSSCGNLLSKIGLVPN